MTDRIVKHEDGSETWEHDQPDGRFGGVHFGEDGVSYRVGGKTVLTASEIDSIITEAMRNPRSFPCNWCGKPDEGPVCPKCWPACEARLIASTERFFKDHA